MKMSGNTILITGGASGIGLELTRQLLARGNKLVMTGRNAAKLQKAKAEFPSIHTVVSDVSKVADIQALFDLVEADYPDVNVLINNAGIMRMINLHGGDATLADISNEIEINLSGPVRMVQAFLPHLKKKPTAAILNVTSGLAFVPLPIAPIYCATKAALHSYTRSLRAQLIYTNVKVFDLAPPATQTEMMDSADPEDTKHISVMKVADMVRAAMLGMEADRYEIRPGQANQLKIMNRIAPEFIFKQLSRPIERMLATVK